MKDLDILLEHEKIDDVKWMEFVDEIAKNANLISNRNLHDLCQILMDMENKENQHGNTFSTMSG